jgi:hypothetical protein
MLGIAMLDEKLIAAYRATDYVLFVAGGRDVTLNIGRPNPVFDRILEERAAKTAVIVTAYNPRSVVLSETENRARHVRLVQFVQSKGYDFALGEGRDPSGQWTAEVECVVFGISAAAGLELARTFDQNAIVFVARGGAPELRYPG